MMVVMISDDGDEYNDGKDDGGGDGGRDVCSYAFRVVHTSTSISMHQYASTLPLILHCRCA
jgi:hypothetical protein